MKTNQHWTGNAPYCSCGQDTVTCQGCGKLVCGNVAVRVSDPNDSRMSRNVGPCCFAKFGLGHAGTEGKSLILDHELIEDARIEARLDAIYDREDREGALYCDE